MLTALFSPPLFGLFLVVTGYKVSKSDCSSFLLSSDCSHLHLMSGMSVRRGVFCDERQGLCSHGRKVEPASFKINFFGSLLLPSVHDLSLTEVPVPDLFHFQSYQSWQFLLGFWLSVCIFLTSECGLNGGTLEDTELQVWKPQSQQNTYIWKYISNSHVGISQAFGSEIHTSKNRPRAEWLLFSLHQAVVLFSFVSFNINIQNH